MNKAYRQYLSDEIARYKEHCGEGATLDGLIGWLDAATSREDSKEPDFRAYARADGIHVAGHVGRQDFDDIIANELPYHADTTTGEVARFIADALGTDEDDAMGQLLDEWAVQAAGTDYANDLAFAVENVVGNTKLGDDVYDLDSLVEQTVIHAARKSFDAALDAYADARHMDRQTLLARLADAYQWADGIAGVYDLIQEAWVDDIVTDDNDPTFEDAIRLGLELDPKQISWHGTDQTPRHTTHETWLFVPGDEADQIKGLLTREPTSASECLGEDEPTISYSASFDDGRSVTIRVHGVKYGQGQSNLPYVQVTLEDADESDIETTEPDGTFFGDWTFEAEDGQTYVAHVRDIRPWQGRPFVLEVRNDAAHVRDIRDTRKGGQDA